MKEKEIFPKGFSINNKYEIIFNSFSCSYFTIYRIKHDAQNYLLKLYDLSKTTFNLFDSSDIPWEVNLLNTLDHKSIPKVIDYGEFNTNDGKYYFIVYEMISGELLSERLNRVGFVGFYEALPIINQVLEIVKYLHNQNIPIIHNNINTNTIWLDYSTGNEKVILDGFQFAKSIRESRKSINPKSLEHDYIAPELYNKIFLQQSDLFSIGAVLYRLILGSPPYYLQFNKYRDIDAFIKEKNVVWEKGININTLSDVNLDEYQELLLEKSLSISIDNRIVSAEEFISFLNREVSLDTLIKENENAQLPKQNFVPKKEGTGFDRIAGMVELKEMIYNDVIRALEEKELYKLYGITIPNGLLLYGPPGCGKTFFAERFAEEIGYNFVYNNPSDVKSKWVNATEEKISALFKNAKENAPTILYFDEISSIMPSREGDLHQMHSSAVEEFLAQMTNCGDHGIFVLASTNYPEKIDSAFLRSGRIDKKFFIPPPDLKAREGIFKLYLIDRPIDLSIDYEELAKMTENYVSSDLKFIVDEGSRIALNRGKQKITMEIIVDIINKTSPSVSKAVLDKYEVISQHFQKHSNSDEIPKIKFGFN